MTYQVFAAAWPSRSDAAAVADIAAGGGSAEAAEFGGFADRMNRLPKYVVSPTLENAEWNNSTIVNENVADEVAKLKAMPGQDILVAGSAQLVQALMQHDRIDEYRLLVYPIVLGSGKRLFADGSNATLRLVETQAFNSGVVALTYRRGAGEGGA